MMLTELAAIIAGHAHVQLQLEEQCKGGQVGLSCRFSSKHELYGSTVASIQTFQGPYTG